MNFNTSRELSAKNNQYLLDNHSTGLAIKKLSILELQALYEAIQDNIKVVNAVFGSEIKH